MSTTGTTSRPAFAPGSTVADAMVTGPAHHGRETPLARLEEFFEDDHVHVALIVDDGVLLAVVDRSDVADAAPETAPAQVVGRLTDRVVGPGADLGETWHAMTRAGRRRLAVVDDEGRCLGLLCLKRSGLGFCSDDDVTSRARSRTGAG